MRKHYFELDKVTSITLNYERESTYKWYEATEIKPRTFLGIRFGGPMLPAIVPAGWSDHEDGYYRKDADYFKNYPWYRVDEKNNKVWNKAYVEINLGYKQSVNTNFDSNEEAQLYVDELLATSDKKFHVIIKK